jgi:methyl-accepting chemotaxis protein
MSVVVNLRETAESASKGTTLIREVTQKTNESVSRIGEASNLITAIAEQTNLLALNAAIEAARAGEQGRGFAVVAEEIRKLAEQSAGATRTIDEMVRELTGHSEVSVKTSEEVGKTVGAQMQSVRETDETYRSISEAVRQSVSGVENASEQTRILNERKNRIMDVMQSLLAVAQENAASTEEVSSSVQMQNAAISEMSEASRQLAVMAQELTAQTAKFKL